MGASDIKLNFGCGEHYVKGWTNIDYESPHRRDVTVDLRQPHKLPFRQGTVTHAYFGHVLEHLHVEDVTDLLSHVRTLMVPGGEIMIVGPDVIKGREMYNRGQIQERLLLQMINGEHRWPGDAHLWQCHAKAVVELLRNSGWCQVQSIDVVSVHSMWPLTSRVGWQCAVTAQNG